MRLLRVLLAAGWLCWALAAQAYEVVDDTGQVTQFQQAPQRVVSILPSLTETVCALGACQRLVGVDRYSNWPAELARLPKLGGGLDPSVEAIVALKPDLVLLATSSPAALRLRALGLKVVQLEPHTGADVRRVMGVLGQVLQVEGAQRLLQRMQAEVQAAAATLPPRAQAWRVYVEVSPSPHAAGRSSFVGELLQALHLDNIVGDEQGPFPRINPEAVVRAAPDLIIANQASLSDMARRPGWSHLKALRQGQVCAFDGAQRDVLVRPGPRMGEAARLLADCVRRHLPAAQPIPLPSAPSKQGTL